MRTTIAAAMALAATTTALAQPAVPQQRVAFARGATSAIVTGTLKGDATVDHVVAAGAGQALSVRIKSSANRAYYNVLPPGTDGVASHVGDDAAPWTGRLADDGDWRVRVYMPRAAARRGEATTYTLTIGVDGTALKPVTADAKVKGSRYHATATVACTPPYAAPTRCDAGVIRRAGGTATVVVTWPQGVRRLLIGGGKVIATDANAPATATRQRDATVVGIGDERYLLPDALVTGG